MLRNPSSSMHLIHIILIEWVPMNKELCPWLFINLHNLIHNIVRALLVLNLVTKGKRQGLNYVLDFKLFECIIFKAHGENAFRPYQHHIFCYGDSRKRHCYGRRMVQRGCSLPLNYISRYMQVSLPTDSRGVGLLVFPPRCGFKTHRKLRCSITSLPVMVTCSPNQNLNWYKYVSIVCLRSECW